MTTRNREVGEVLADLRQLKNGWHEGEGLPLDERVFDAAVSLLSKRPQLANAYRIYPTLLGGILFEFENEGWDLSVEFTPEGSVELSGLRIDGPDKLGPEVFTAFDQRFLDAFDTYVNR